LLDPGVVPYPLLLGRLATDHRRPSAFLMFTNANCEGDTFGESNGERVVLGEWHRGIVGLVVCTIMLFLCDLLAALRLTDSSFLNCWRLVKLGSTD